MPITHAKVSAVADGGDTSQVRPSDWNADHVGAPAGSAISDLPAVTVPDPSDEFPVNQGGTTKKVTLGQLAAGNVAPLASDADLPTAVAGINAILAAMKVALLMASGYADMLLATLPLGYWRLGEPSGTAANDEVSTNDGVYESAPTLGVTGALAGDSNTAVTFAGTQYMHTTGGGFTTAANWSVSAWLKPSSLPQSNAMAVTVCNAAVNAGVQFGVGAGAGGGSGSHLQLGIMGIAWAEGVYVFPNTTSWHMVVLTRASGSIHIYVDGAEVGTCADVPAAPTDGYVGAGATPANTFQYLGSVDEVATWDRELTSTEVAALYAKGV